MKTFRHFWRYFAKCFLEWEMFHIKVVEKTKTHILCSITCFQKSHHLWDNAEKCGDRGVTNDVTTWRIRVACWISKAICTYAQAHARVSTCTHARASVHTHRPICNTYCFSTDTTVSWTHLNITLYVHCLSWLRRSLSLPPDTSCLEVGPELLHRCRSVQVRIFQHPIIFEFCCLCVEITYSLDAENTNSRHHHIPLWISNSDMDITSCTWSRISHPSSDPEP
jgi:hypothetical protein